MTRSYSTATATAFRDRAPRNLPLLPGTLKSTYGNCFVSYTQYAVFVYRAFWTIDVHVHYISDDFNFRKISNLDFKQMYFCHLYSLPTCV